MLAVFSFIASPLGKIAMYLLGALTAAGIVWGVISYHDAQLKTEALYQYNQTQLQQTVKDQADQISHLNQINSDQQTIVDNVNKKNNDLAQKTDTINSYINAQKPVAKDTVAPVLLETFKQLKALDQ